MTELSEIQLAMCQVIKECGFEGLNRVKLNSLLIGRASTETYDPKDNWIIELDGHKLTQDEYEAWVKQND